jgi:hypothetical protein
MKNPGDFAKRNDLLLLTSRAKEFDLTNARCQRFAAVSGVLLGFAVLVCACAVLAVISPPLLLIALPTVPYILCALASIGAILAAVGVVSFSANCAEDATLKKSSRFFLDQVARGKTTEKQGNLGFVQSYWPIAIGIK